ncbi:MAG: respiratory nitrate reductase subunit gamma [Marmoricola sp.]
MSAWTAASARPWSAAAGSSPGPRCPGVSIWFRGIFRFDLHPDLMGQAPLGFQLRGLIAMSLFALWPFTRLVHVFSAPLGYLTRPYIVYRSRDDQQLGSHSPRRGWERIDK